ncbi:MAG: hypothetical protein B7Z57_01105 [Acidiphilium sp. 37-60-79]|nr:MAG: hypothetical protein B7Z57_01105 [Acidiphilium sp. 37-60-79]OZB40357.1 MAG: hypothetical protein B7X48_05545 [Acidiphilium sp. 34-60-192]
MSSIRLHIWYNGKGFDVKVLSQLIRLRKQETAEVDEQETLLTVYKRALSMG